jgi:hypothetical protein
VIKTYVIAKTDTKAILASDDLMLLEINQFLS